MSVEVIDVDDWSKPLPDPGAPGREFYAAAARGELRYQRCPQCDHAQFYPRAVCTACGADPEWATAGGRGTVHTFTVVRQSQARGFRDELPYAVAMVELDEGVKMMGGISGCDPGDVHIGMAVEAFAVRVEEDLAIPFWRPAPA